MDPIYLSQKERQAVLDRCKRDLYYLGKEILGYDLAEDIPHRELCAFIDPESQLDRSSWPPRPGKPVSRKMLIGTRGIYKTCFGTIARAVQLILRNPNVRILVVMKKMATAADKVNEIRLHFERNEKLRALAPNLIPENPRTNPPWSKHAFVVNRPGIFSEPTVTASGVEGQLAGGHYDYILGDDVVAADKDDLGQEGIIVLREEETQKSINWYKLNTEGLKILRRDKSLQTEIQFIVNRWGPYDFARYIMDHHRQEYKVKVMAAHREDGSLLWEGVLDEEELERIRQAQGDFYYFTQVECSPYSPESLSFPVEMNQYWTGDRPPGYERMKPYLLIDIADKNKPSACNTAMVLVYVDADYHIWVQEAIIKRMDVPAKLDNIARLVETYQLHTVYIEENLHVSTLQHAIKERIEKSNIRYAVRLLKPKNRNKDARIQTLEPRHRSRGIHFKKSQRQLLIEFRDFPNSWMKDGLDALAYITDLVRFMPRRKEEPEFSGPQFDDTVTIKKIKEEIKAKQWGGMALISRQGRNRRRRIA